MPWQSDAQVLSSPSAPGSVLDVRQVVHRLIETTASVASRKGLSLDCQVDKALPRLFQGSSVRLRVFIEALFVNALLRADWGVVTITVDHMGWDADNRVKVRFQTLAHGESLTGASSQQDPCGPLEQLYGDHFTWGQDSDPAGTCRFWVVIPMEPSNGGAQSFSDEGANGAEGEGANAEALSGQAEPLFDRSMAEQLKEAIGEETFRIVLDDFRVQAISLLALMAQETKLPEVRRAAHDLRSTALNFGLCAAAAHAAHVERLCHAGQRPSQGVLQVLEETLSAGIEQVLTYSGPAQS